VSMRIREQESEDAFGRLGEVVTRLLLNFQLFLSAEICVLIAVSSWPSWLQLWPSNLCTSVPSLLQTSNVDLPPLSFQVIYLLSFTAVP